ncbi:MAG: hypothetical protein P8181_15110 [bacterium]
MPRQFIRCCVCGHEFDVPAHMKDLEKCPKCRGRRLMWKFDDYEVLKTAVKTPNVAKQKDTLIRR